MHVPKHHYLLLKLLQELPNSSSSFLLVHLVMYQPSEMVKLNLTREIIQIFISFFFFVLIEIYSLIQPCLPREIEKR